MSSWSSWRASKILLVGVNLGWPIEIPMLIPVGVGLLLMVIGNLMPRMRPNWFMGIRTPWTLASESVWRKTHRLGGYCFMAMGVLMVAIGFVATPGAIPLPDWGRRRLRHHSGGLFLSCLAPGAGSRALLHPSRRRVSSMRPSFLMFGLLVTHGLCEIAPVRAQDATSRTPLETGRHRVRRPDGATRFHRRRDPVRFDHDRGDAPGETRAETWDDVEGQVGPFQGWSQTATGTVQGYDFVLVTSAFETAVLDIRVDIR